MSVTIWVGNKSFSLGSPAFLKAFFSTVFERLEGGKWGSRYPALMRDLYSGRLTHKDAPAAEEELREIRERLASLELDQLVWDFEDSAASPPWGSEISPHVSSLANYFVTADGKELLDVLASVLDEASRRRRDVEIR